MVFGTCLLNEAAASAVSQLPPQRRELWWPVMELKGRRERSRLIETSKSRDCVVVQ